MNLLTNLPFLFAIIWQSTHAMLLKTWGTSSQPNRLAFSIRDLADQSFQFATAAQKGVYPIEDIRRNYTQEWHGITSVVIFQAYNGWIENLSLNTSELTDHGKVRRLILTGAERSMALRNPDFNDETHQHEEILCDGCITLTIKRIHYGYEVVYFNYEASGTLTNDNDIHLAISFQLTIQSGHNKTINKDYCFTQLEPIVLTPKHYYINNDNQSLNKNLTNLFSIKMKNIGIFNFLAEHVDTWMGEHFGTVILPSLKERIDISMRKMLNLHNPCERFLTS